MNLKMKSNLIYVFFIYLFMNVFLFGGSGVSKDLVSAGNYYTDEYGNVYIALNVIGHVKNPGTYIVHENADIFTILSHAGGTLRGAKLSETTIYKNSSNAKVIDLQKILKTGEKVEVSFQAYDTIYIKETNLSYLLSNASIFNTLLQIFNIYLTILR